MLTLERAKELLNITTTEEHRKDIFFYLDVGK